MIFFFLKVRICGGKGVLIMILVSVDPNCMEMNERRITHV
jgi:hypothetical protein